MPKKQAISTLLTQTYAEINENMKETGFQVFKDMKSILVIRSASIQILDKFIQEARAVNPELQIHLVTHSRDVPTLKSLYDGNFDIIEYSAGGMYCVDNMRDHIQHITDALPDAWVMLCHNQDGFGFDNVFEVAHALADAPLYFYNNSDRIYLVVSPEEQINNLRLIKTILDWNWESAGSRREH